MTYRIAAVQMASGPNVLANLNEAAQFIKDAALAGAKLVVLPENFAQMPKQDQTLLQIQENMGEGIIQDFLRQQAKLHRIWIVGGTIPIRSNGEKIRAACLLINDNGQYVARYDKIHLFDVSIAHQEHYCESKIIDPGNEIVVAETPFGKLGLAVCYDLRFPELFRNMLNFDVQIISIVAAFTAATGKAHWEVLLRARAIENLCYVVAADQGGYHVNGRETHGDSMIIDPWGGIMTRLKQGSGLVYADIDVQNLTALQQRFPVRTHRRIENNNNL